MDGDICCTMCVLCLTGCIQDADCSGRTLATLLVAWVVTLMVTSILLQWNYMWIVLTVLTIVFLIICACVAYNIKRAYLRTCNREYEQTGNERGRRGRGALWTISGITVDNCGEGESQRGVDLPPSYSSVVMSVQPTSESARPPLTNGDSPNNSKFQEDPPPYSSVIFFTDTRDRNAEVADESNAISSDTTKNNTVFVARTQETRTTDD